MLSCRPTEKVVEFFSVSKLAWLLIQPVSAVFVALLLGVVLLWMGRVLLARAFLLAVAVAYGFVIFSNVGQLLLLPLENKYTKPALDDAQPVAGIIVLGGGFDGRVTQGRGGYALGEAGDRFTEAVSLAQRFGDVPIIISGGDASFIGTTEGDAAIAPRFFEALGVSASRVLLEDRSRNTHENALYTAALIDDLPNRDGAWIVVTSAFHMPRSVASFALTPLEIIAWPVDYRTAGDERFRLGRDDPLRAIAEFNLAVREWIGIFVYRLTDRANSGALSSL